MDLTKRVSAKTEKRRMRLSAIEIIGEASKFNRRTAAGKSANSMETGKRNTGQIGARLFSNIKLSIVWETVKNDLPILKTEIEKILENLS